MDEEGRVTNEMFGNNQQQTLSQNTSSIETRTDDDLTTIRSKLETLPFEDEKEKVALLKNVQCLQDYHVIQIFNLAVAPLQKCMKKPSELVREVTKLFELCVSFCYTDMPKRIAFYYYVKALKFCFPSPPKHCRTSTVVSLLLQLVQDFQEGKLIVNTANKTEPAANLERLSRRTNHFVDDILAIFDKRRDGGCIEKIFAQTVRFATADAEIVSKYQTVQSVFFPNWIKLLRLENVSNSFAAGLAKVDPLQWQEQRVSHSASFQPGLTDLTGITDVTCSLQTMQLVYTSIVCNVVGIVEDMKSNGSEVSLLSTKKRQDVFFRYIDHFFHHPFITETSLKLISTTSINNNVLEEVLNLFWCQGPLPDSPQTEAKAQAFNNLFKVLSLLPDGNLVYKVLNFWRRTSQTNEKDYRILASLMALFSERLPCEEAPCQEERADKILNFWKRLPVSLRPTNDSVFSINVIKQLTLCENLSFKSKEILLRELNNLAKQFKGQEERNVFQEIIGGVREISHCIDELLSEILDFLKRFVNTDIPMKTIPHEVLQLLSLVLKTSISGDRRLKVLQKSKESRKGLLVSSGLLDVIRKFHLEEGGANEYFDLMCYIVFDILEEDDHLCKEFFEEHFRQPGMGNLGMTDCEKLQLFTELRSFSKTIDNTPDVPDQLRLHFASSIVLVVQSVRFSGKEKLLLVRKVFDIFLYNSQQGIERALHHLIPLDYSNNSTSLSNKRHLEMFLTFDEVFIIMADLTMMTNLSRIPASKKRSLSSVLSAINSDLISRDRLVDIYRFIGSQEDLDRVFFNYFLSVLEAAIQAFNSMDKILEVFQALRRFLVGTPSDLIPLSMLSFEYMLQNQIEMQKMARFVEEVIMKWDFAPPKVSVLSFLKVPQLLWKAYTATDSTTRIHRFQGILKETNEDVELYCTEFNTALRDNVRRISPCELEWLIFHSPLSNDEAGVAFKLCFRSLNLQMKCFHTPLAVKIEKEELVFLPQETVPEQHFGSKDMIAHAPHNLAETSVAVRSQSVKSFSAPVTLAEEVIQNLKRLLGQGEDILKTAMSLWKDFRPTFPLKCCRQGCPGTLPSLDEYLEMILSILAVSSTKEVAFYWVHVRRNRHHLSQYLDVILKACRKTSAAEYLDEKSRLNFHDAVYTTMERSSASSFLFFGMVIQQPSVSCFQFVKPQLKQLSNVLGSRLSVEETLAVLDLFQVSVPAGVTVGHIASLWSCKKERLELIKRMKCYCNKEDTSSLQNDPAQSNFVLQLAQAFGRLCMNSCKDLLVRFQELDVLYDPEDAYGLNRLPNWRQLMIADGFPVIAIDSWCVAFLTTPLDHLTSRDVDAIVDLKSDTLQLVASVSQRIKHCLFPEDGFKDFQENGNGIKGAQFKERLRLARLLGEFINVLKVRKPEGSKKDAAITEKVVQACNELCNAHENQKEDKKENQEEIKKKRKKGNDLYKIHGQNLKALFVEIFGKQQRSNNNAEDQTTMTQQSVSGAGLPFTRQTSYLHENLPSVLSRSEVYDPLLFLLRRWLSAVVAKPVLSLHVKKIVQSLFSFEFSKSKQPKELHGNIQDRILSLENNRALIAQLQAAGYNRKGQSSQVSKDLWSSPSVECSGYLSGQESADDRRFRKKLARTLRAVWSEWRDILFMCNVVSIKVGEEDVCAKDLFGVQSSLEEMEEQLSAVKKTISQFTSEDLARRVTQLVRKEQRHRVRIKKFHQKNKNSKASQSERGEMKKFVAVWENRFLENVKLCSERIPGCYAPNGFHSEKPVLCALSVDNRILTVFKEEKRGKREEIENVEVKLFEAGMFVYGLHSSGHDYVTDELWVAFYKMLLEEGLVPRIVLSNESPGFDWIKKYAGIQTVKRLSYPSWQWELHDYGIVPLEEDYFDYLPVHACLFPELRGLTEFVTLTMENVSSFLFHDFKEAHIVEEKEERTRQMAGKAIEELKKDESISEEVVGKLTFAVKETIKKIVDGQQVTEDSVNQLIAKKKKSSAQRNANQMTVAESLEQYKAVVLRACEKARSEFPESPQRL
ncbi:uncharacterized protein [Montipora foliosa]|uniref:uncharacterized protein n=1 Tax=Montipora foliosa TaxID=591990 RepID=UPI0035F20521